MKSIHFFSLLRIFTFVIIMGACQQDNPSVEKSENNTSTEGNTMDQGNHKDVLRHVVLFKFKDSSSVEDIKTIEDSFRKLPKEIDEILDFEWGTDVSVENISRGFTHCFFVSFLSEKERDIYLPHPAHKAFVELCSPHIDKVLVFDYHSKE